MGVVPIVSRARSPACAQASAQVGFKPSTKALKPDFKKLNPLTGLKNMFSPNSAVEAVKSSLKIGAVGGIIAIVDLPEAR